MKKNIKELTDEQISSYVEKFMYIYRKDKYSRYHSYDHMHKLFVDYKNGNSENKTLDDLALNLFAFMGSWGMLVRGSSLMLKDYKFWVEIVKILVKDDYIYLVDIDPFKENFDKDKYASLVVKVTEEIKNYLNNNKIYYKTDGTKINGIVNLDTVFGKILMVTYGCVPAYDTYVRKGLSALNICQTVGKKSCNDLIEYCKEHKEYLQSLTRMVNEETTGVYYTVFKVLDMITWEYGFELESKSA